MARNCFMDSCPEVNNDCYSDLRLSLWENTSTMSTDSFFDIYEASAMGGRHSSMVIATHMLDVLKREYPATRFIEIQKRQDELLLHRHVFRMKHSRCEWLLCGAYGAVLYVYAPLLLAAGFWLDSGPCLWYNETPGGSC